MVTLEHASSVLFTEEQIQARVSSMGEQISFEYSGKDLVLVGILRGSFIFLADLARSISIPLILDFVSFSSYGDSTESCGSVTVLKGLQEDVRGKHVLVVEDIVDTGCTLVKSHFLQKLSENGAASVRVCALLDKPAKRQFDVDVHYVGFQVQDEFVVGYGLDYGGLYRNLPFISVLNE